MKSKSLDIILAVLLLLTVGSSFAHTWEQTSAFPQLDYVTMSADGRIICAAASGGTILISTNWGTVWTPITNGYPFFTWGRNVVAVSGDGSKIFAQSVSLGTSTNYGATWTPTTSQLDSSSPYIACSADGAKVVVAEQHLFISTNGGNTCYTSSAPVANWSSVAISADGSRMFAVSIGGLFLSTNSGADWTLSGSSPAGGVVCASSDGKCIGTATFGDSYVSRDGGATWITNGFGGYSISCSADGMTWAIAYPTLHTSIDGGITWQTNAPTSSSIGAAVSADGSEIALIGAGGLWIGRTTPSPQLNIQSQGSNMALSWLIPSTNFILQQNADPVSANWVPLSNTPSLNFTNLHQELALPTATNSSFFRLMAQ